jgi:hypothetical protein
MASGNPSLVVKIGANIDALKAALQLGQSELIKTAAGAQALAGSLNGQKLEQNALQMAVAIKAVGGATTLSVAEAKKADAIFTAWLEKAAKTGKAVSPELAKIAAETKKVAEETKKAEAASGGFFAKLAGGVAVGNLVADSLKAIGSAALSAFSSAAMALPNMIKQTMDLGGSLFDLSLKTGASVENLSRLRYVSSQTGIGMDTFTNSMFKMQVALGQSGSKAEEVGKNLSKLGLDMKTLKDSRPDDAFIAILSGLEKIPNRADQARAGMALFGKGFKDMAGLTQESITELLKASDDLGLTLSTEMAAAADIAGDALNRIKMQGEALALRIGAAFLPAVIGLAENFSGALKDAIGEANKALGAMGGGNGFLATVARAMGQGNDALAAQVQLYEMLRDATISFVRGGVMPLITAFSYLMVAGYAVRNLYLDLTYAGNLAALGVELVVVGYKKLWAAMNPSEANLTALQTAQNNAAQLVIAIDDVRTKLMDAKRAQENWAEGGRAANAVIEAALNKLARTHFDVTKMIQQNAALSREAVGGLGAEIEDTGEKAKEAGEATAKWLAAWEAAAKKGRESVALFQNSFVKLGGTIVQVIPDAGTAGKQFEFLKLQLLGVHDTIATKFLPLMPALKGNMSGLKNETRGWADTFVTLGGVFENINSKIGQTFQITGNAIKQIKDLGDAGKNMGEKMVVGFTAAAAIVQQYGAGTVIAAAATGLLSGAAAGSALAMLAHVGAATALGAAFMGVGAAVGALIGAWQALRAEEAAARAEAEKAQNTYVQLTQDLYDLVGTTDDLAALAGVVGDVTENGQDLAEVIAYLDSHQFSGTARLEYFASAYETFVKRQKELMRSVSEGYKLASQELLDYMAVAAKVSGSLSKTAKDYYLAQLGTAAAGLTQMFVGMGKASTAAAQAAAVKLHMAAGMTEDAAKKAASSIVGIFVKSQAQATGLAAAIAGTFAEMIAKGATFKEALAAIQEPLDAMRKQLQLTGLQGGAAFENLSRMGEIANGEITGPLTDAIAGANAALQGLHNAGMLNQEMFGGIATSATDAYNQIIAQGADGQAALMMMQPTLQTIWKLQQDFGYEVDATTQALLDQAVASGLVGEAQMTDAQKQTAALEGIQDAVEQLVVLFGGTLPDAIGKTTQAAVSAASTIDGRMQTLISRDWSLDVQVNYDDPGFDPSANSSGMASGGVVYAAGGWTAKGTDIVPAMLTPGERVLTVGQNYDYENRMRTGGASASPVNVNVTIQALDPVGLKQVVEREVVPLLVSAYRRNVNGARTDTRKELVE